MKYSLRSLLIVAILAPPLLAFGVCFVGLWIADRKSEISKPITKRPPITFDLTPRRVIGTTDDGYPLVDLDDEFHPKPAP